MRGASDVTNPGSTRRGTLSRRHLAAAAWLTIAATAIELGASRHWNGASQLIPWAALVLAAAAVVGARSRRRRARAGARLASAAVLAASFFGVFVHVQSNYEAGPLDFRFETRWSEMSLLSRWWAAVNGSVGPAPLLAPLVLAQAAILVAAVAWVAPAERRIRARGVPEAVAFDTP